MSVNESLNGLDEQYIGNIKVTLSLIFAGKINVYECGCDLIALDMFLSVFNGL